VFVYNSKLIKLNVKVSEQKPFTFCSSIFEEYSYPDTVKVSCISLPNIYYDFDPFRLTCTCPEFVEKNQFGEVFAFRSSCFHRYEWLAYAPEELLLNSLYPKAIYEQYFAKSEHDYKNTLSIITNNNLVIIPILKDSYSLANSFNKSGYTIIKEEQENSRWVGVYFNGTRYGYSFINGCWTEKSPEFEKISSLVTICINKELFDCFKAKPNLVGEISNDSGNIKYEGYIQKLKISMTLNARASYVQITSNLLCEARYDTINKKLLPKRDNQFDERYLWLENSLFLTINNMLEQRIISKNQMIKIKTIKNNENFSSKKILRTKESNVLCSDSKQINFGVKTKRGDLYYYLTFESPVQKKLSKFKKITTENLATIPLSWISNNYHIFSKQEGEPTVFPWSETEIEQLIHKRLQKYGGLIKQS
jgi:hypothetical protein